MSRIREELLQIDNKTNNLLRKQANGLARTFSKGRTQTANKHTGRCSASFVTAETQTQTTAGRHLSQTPISVIENRTEKD